MNNDGYFAIGVLLGLVCLTAIVAIVVCLPAATPRGPKAASPPNTTEHALYADDRASHGVSSSPQATPESYIPALSSIATNVWRMKKRIADSGSVTNEVDTNRIHRHLEATIASLEEVGVQIHDLQGRRYDSGMALKVIAFEPTPGLFEDQIIDSVKPTITWNERLIQIGEVIVGTPDIESESAGEQ